MFMSYLLLSLCYTLDSRGVIQSRESFLISCNDAGVMLLMVRNDLNGRKSTKSTRLLPMNWLSYPETSEILDVLMKFKYFGRISSNEKKAGR